MKTWIRLITGHYNGRWILSSTHDPSKQAQKVDFRKLIFNNAGVSKLNSQKLLRVELDHLDIVFSKMRKTIGILRKLNNVLPMGALETIF